MQIFIITPNPKAVQGNKRVVEFLNLETGSDRIPVMKLHYEARTYESANEGANEIIEFRKTSHLTATNDTMVDENGVIDENGTIGERDFYIAAMFSGNYTEEQLIGFAILNADAAHRFD